MASIPTGHPDGGATCEPARLGWELDGGRSVERAGDPDDAAGCAESWRRTANPPTPSVGCGRSPLAGTEQLTDTTLILPLLLASGRATFGSVEPVSGD
jgi:hypothetical protein